MWTLFLTKEANPGHASVKGCTVRRPVVLSGLFGSKSTGKTLLKSKSELRVKDARIYSRRSKIGHFARNVLQDSVYSTERIC